MKRKLHVSQCLFGASVMSLESKYIEGKEVPFYDAEISEIVNSYDFEGGGKSMLVAIQNLDNETYRIIKAEGLHAYMNIASDLNSLGLHDELMNDLSGRDGLDSLFIPTKDLKASVVKQLDIFMDVESKKVELEELTETERKTVILSRVGQGAFREGLIKYWGGCSVTNCRFIPLLRASHIKPWRDSSNKERLDVFNGFLLTPHLDAAFDSGYITFDSSGKIIISLQL